jgi:autophagy-related protein 11
MTRGLEWNTANGETPLHEERRALEAEVARLNRELRIAGDEHERVQQLEYELHQARLQIESETAARRILEDRYTSLLSIVERQQQELGNALSEAAGNTKAADQRTSQVHDLEGSLAQGKDSTTEVAIRIQTRSAPDGDVRQVLDRVAEADEGQVALKSAELRGEGEGVEHQRKEATVQVKADAAGLRADPQHAEGGLRDAQHAQHALNVLQEEKGTQAGGRASQSKLGHKAEENANDRFVTQLLEISIAYRTTHFKALALARSAVSQPSTHKESSGGTHHTHPGNDQRSTTATIPTPPDEPSPFVDRSDPAGAIKILRLDDHDRFLDVIAKTASSIHKWQKQCKEYRERAKERISFRKFSKGDLALFLPLRKPGSKLWAAFTGAWNTLFFFSLFLPSAGARSSPFPPWFEAIPISSAE